MEETLAVNAVDKMSDIPPMDIESFRSKLEDIKKNRSSLNDSESMNFVSKQIREDVISAYERITQIALDEKAVAGFEPHDFDAFLEELKKEVSSAEDDNIRISNNIDDITKTFYTELDSLDGDIEELCFSLNLIDSQVANVGQFFGEARTGTMDVSEDKKFEILKLQQQTEMCKNNLSILQDLDAYTKRFESVSQIEDKLSDVKVLEFEGNCIRISMKTSVPSSDGLLFRHKFDNLVKPHVVEHELLVEVVDNTLELRKVEIFPNDVCLDDILLNIKSSSNLAFVKHGSQLESLVRQVQHCIILCTLKKLLLKDAKMSRHSFEHSERDEMITAHMVGGIDAFINIPQSWPLSNSGLKLISLKNSMDNSKSISLGLLYKIKEHANSLNVHTRSNLTKFMDAIEETLVQEMRSEKLS